MEKYLTYEQFGAAGDGATDDFDAIIACHEQANKIGATVKASDGARYYIKKIATAVIKTDVDFGSAEFIIDDVDVPLDRRGANIFNVVSDYKKISLDIKSFKKDLGRLEFPHTGNAYVKLVDATRPQFIRKGLNKNAGKPMTDAFVVDGDGNVKNRVNYDYDNITEAFYKCIDDTPITVKGGKFTTVANRAESFYNYHGRGFGVQRCNVTLENITHTVTGELDHGAPYAGFIAVNESVNVTLRNCMLTPHFIYWTPSKEPGKLVPMGSYDINFGNSLNCTISGIRQTVNIHDNRYWGLIHTNFCKDLLVENCVMSRYDAHEGVTNVVIRNCEFGHQKVNLIGYGEALLENCIMTGANIFHLRGDYGSFWNGNITLRCCTLNAVNPNGDCCIFWAYNEGDHYFGYDCAMPTVLTLENVTINDEKIAPNKDVFLLPKYDSFKISDKPYPYTTTKKLVVKNLSISTGRKYRISPCDEHYEGLTVIEEQ